MKFDIIFESDHLKVREPTILGDEIATLNLVLQTFKKYLEMEQKYFSMNSKDIQNLIELVDYLQLVVIEELDTQRK